MLVGVWQFVLTNHLRVDAKEHPIMIAEPTFNTPAQREKVKMSMTQFNENTVFVGLIYLFCCVCVFDAWPNFAICIAALFLLCALLLR